MSLYVFANPALFPANLLGYVDPTDNYAYQGILEQDGTLRKYNSFEELLAHIDQRRAALRYPKIPHLDLQIQHYLYLIGESSRSHFVRIDQHPKQADIPREVKTDVIIGAKIAYEFSREAVTGLWRSGASGWATKTEANERAKTCANCPHNQKLKKSTIERINNRVAMLFTLKRSTDYDDKLYECGVCGCPNAEKVHYAASIIRKVTPAKYRAESFPESFIGVLDRERYRCWVREILEKEDGPTV